MFFPEVGPQSSFQPSLPLAPSLPLDHLCALLRPRNIARNPCIVVWTVPSLRAVGVYWLARHLSRWTHTQCLCFFGGWTCSSSGPGPGHNCSPDRVPGFRRSAVEQPDKQGRRRAGKEQSDQSLCRRVITGLTGGLRRSLASLGGSGAWSSDWRCFVRPGCFGSQSCGASSAPAALRPQHPVSRLAHARAHFSSHG